MKSYKPQLPITVIPAGKRWAIVTWKKLNIHGFAGWLLREAADFVAFKDLESWPKAARQWLKDFGEAEDCPFCRGTTH